MLSGFDAFKITETLGVPLEIILDCINGKYVIDWVDFINTGRQSGWTDLTIYKKIKYSVEDVFTKEQSEYFLYSLRNILINI